MKFGWDWVIVLLVVLLLFGSARLPSLFRSMGSAQREFKKGLHDGDAEKPADNQNT